MAPNSPLRHSISASDLPKTYEINGETIILSDRYFTAEQPKNDDVKLTEWFLSRTKVFRPSLKVEEAFKDADVRLHTVLHRWFTK